MNPSKIIIRFLACSLIELLGIIWVPSDTQAQTLASQEPKDLRVELTSATGSSRFQIGELIPIQVSFSSNTPRRYLHPCWENDPQADWRDCRLSYSLSSAIVPAAGWVDRTKEYPPDPFFTTSARMMYQGPTRYLGPNAVQFPYRLTERYRFDSPGRYVVRLSIAVNVDDEGGQSETWHPAMKYHQVVVTREITIEIVPARQDWQHEIVRKGVSALNAPQPQFTGQPSAEFMRYEQDIGALCNLSTPEVSRLLGTLLSQGNANFEGCLEESPNFAVALNEQRRLQADPAVAVTPAFFAAFSNLLSKEEAKKRQRPLLEVRQQAEDNEREALCGALQRRHGKAQITSLATLLRSRSQEVEQSSPHIPAFSPAVIAMAAANFGRLPGDTKELLLGPDWRLVRSAAMLPALRGEAEAGDGPALRHWLELDPAGATPFAYTEAVRKPPRFSAFDLNIPKASLPEQERQIAANFVALGRGVSFIEPEQTQGLQNSATLLYRYATVEILPVVLPVIDARLSQWSCLPQFATLAYLTKVSTTAAAPRLRKAFRNMEGGECSNRRPFTNIGFLQPSSVLGRAAVAEIDAGTDEGLAEDGARYLQFYGSPSMKPAVWTELVVWHKRYVANGGEHPTSATAEINQRSREMQLALTRAYVGAQAWTISPEEWREVTNVLGAATEELVCNFGCGISLSTDPDPGTYVIRRERTGEATIAPPARFMDAGEGAPPGFYSINSQYGSLTLRSLEAKILQLPAGSTFSMDQTFAPFDASEIAAITTFLRQHHYRMKRSRD
jgi:hypothetical protein